MEKIISNSIQCSVKNTYKQKGITLIELMIALVIASIVIAAVLINVANVGRTSIVQGGQSEMIETGQYALNTLTKHIRNAGYSDPTEIPSSLVDRPDRFGLYLLGCTENAISPTRASILANWGASCAGSAGKSQSIAVRYQEGQLIEAPPLNAGSSTLVKAAALDCTGATVGAAGNSIKVDGKDRIIVDNRFYIKNGALTCWGNATNAELKLVDNIEHMEFLYGVSERMKVSSFEILAGENSHYMTAAQLKGTFSGEGEKAWERVTSVRICLIVRSRTSVPTTVLPYTNCQGVLTPINDGYLRKAMLTTVEIANMGSGSNKR